MAEQSTDVETCTVCLEVCIEPKVLPCYHTFCKKCLEGILDESESKEKLACPQCRAKHQVPSSGADGFQNDYTFSGNKIKQNPKVDTCEQCDDQGIAVCLCTECSAHLCDSCRNAHKSHEIVSLDSEGVQFGTDKPKVFCSQHPDKLLYLFCKTCECVVCLGCNRDKDSHSNHPLVMIKTDLRKDVEKQIEDLVVEVQTKLTDFEANHKYISDVEKETMDEPIPMRAEINKVFDSLVTQLEAQRSALLEKVEASSNEDLKDLWAQKEHVEKTITSLRSTLSFTERSLQCYDDLEFLVLGSQVMASLKELKKVNWDNSGTDFIDRTIREVKFRDVADIDLAVGELEAVTMKDDLEILLFGMPPSPKLGQRIEFKIGRRVLKSRSGEKLELGLQVYHGKNKIYIPQPLEKCADPSGQSWSVAFVPVVSGDHVVRVKLRTHLSDEARREILVSVTGAPAVNQIIERGPDWDWNNEGCGSKGRVDKITDRDCNIHVIWNVKAKVGDYRWGTKCGCYDVQLVV